MDCNTPEQPSLVHCSGPTASAQHYKHFPQRLTGQPTAIGSVPTAVDGAATKRWPVTPSGWRPPDNKRPKIADRWPAAGSLRTAVDAVNPPPPEAVLPCLRGT